MRHSLFTTALLVSLTIAIPATAQERRPLATPQAEDIERPVRRGEPSIVLGVAAADTRAHNRRILGLSLTIPGAVLLGTGLVWMASLTDSSCEADLFGGICPVDAWSRGSAWGLTAVGAGLTLVGIALWGSASGLATRAPRLDSAQATPWISPTNGGAVAGVRIAMR